MARLDEVQMKKNDRYDDITIEEQKKTIAKYFDQFGNLKQFPAKEKGKIIILGEIAKNFPSGEHYNETEINCILKIIYYDYSYIRRLLIDYGFLERSDSGSEYWIKE
jgi:hypothetical protein